MTRTRPAALRELKASHGAHGDAEGHHSGKPGHAGTGRKLKARKHKLQKHPLHKHKHKHKHHRRPKHHAPVSGLPGAPAPPMVPVNPPAPSPAPPPVVEDTLTLARARRLLWRAGFGPAPGQAEALVGSSVAQAVFSLTRPSGAAVLHGPEAHNEEGEALQPADEWGRTTAGGWTA